MIIRALKDDTERKKAEVQQLFVYHKSHSDWPGNETWISLVKDQ